MTKITNVCLTKVISRRTNLEDDLPTFMYFTEYKIS